MEIREMRNIIGFTLEEILIASPYQHQGIGSWLLNELEHKVSEKGASILELLAVNDDLHEYYYGKANSKSKVTAINSGLNN